MDRKKRTHTEEVEPNMGLNEKKTANKKRETEDKMRCIDMGKENKASVCMCARVCYYGA